MQDAELSANTAHLIELAFRFLAEHVLCELAWPDLEETVSSSLRIKTKPGYRDVLPLLACAVSGGDVKQALPLAAAWMLFNQASNLFDDLQDQDHKPLIWNSWEPVRASHMGLGMIAAGQLSLAKLKADRQAHVDILQAYASTMAVAAREQRYRPESPGLEPYFQHVIGKSGLLYATVAWSGVRVHSSDRTMLDAMHEYGLSLGILIQLLDDCRDLHNGYLSSDLHDNPFTLPVLYVLTQGAGPHRERLSSLVQLPDKTPAAIAEICDILEEAKAFSYCLALMKVYEQKALKAIHIFPEERTAPLRAYATSFLQTIVGGS